MKTNQVMLRPFCGHQIPQRTEDGFFNATEIVSAFNRINNQSKDLYQFFDNDGTKDFLQELAISLNTDKSKCLGTITESDLYEKKRGRYGGTWVHPYVFTKICMWLSPKFEVEAVKWIYDNLIDFRHQAGDHYKEMCTAIMDRYVEYYDSNPSPLIFSNESRLLNSLVKGEFKSIDRNELSEKELDLLNNLQVLNIKMLNGRLGKKERHSKLKQYAEMFKMANQM